MSDDPPPPRGFQTTAIHTRAANDDAGPPGDPVAPGLALSTTWAWRDVSDAARYASTVEPAEFYRRLGHPNAVALERRLAALEGAERALAVASGMAACTVALLALTEPDSHVVCARTVYGEVSSFLRTLGPRARIRAVFAGGPEVEHFRAAITPGTRLVFVECPANPTLDLVDLRAVSELVHSVGALVVCDATLATPYNCRPLSLGCDLVVHSATKYLAGHSDAMGGVLAGRADLVERCWHLVRVMGAVISPFDAWLIDRGLRTLGLRMERHNTNAERVADFLRAHPAVERVAYPTAPTHHAHAWARTQHRGFGGVLSVVIRGGAPAAERFVRGLELFTVATSLGGVESLAQFPASMARLTADDRARLGIPDGMVRLAVGCEDADDLVADLARALG